MFKFGKSSKWPQDSRFPKSWSTHLSSSSDAPVCGSSRQFGRQDPMLNGGGYPYSPANHTTYCIIRLCLPFQSSEKYESQWLVDYPIYIYIYIHILWKIKTMFQTTNQMVICSNKREQESDGIQAALSSLADAVRCPELSWKGQVGHECSNAWWLEELSNPIEKKISWRYNMI